MIPAMIVESVRQLLAAGLVHRAVQVALAAAKEAGDRAVVASGHLPADQQFALALQATDEYIEALAVELAGGQEGEE